MLKIVSGPTANGRAILKLEGRVIGPWVEEVRRSCDEVLAAGASLTLDCSEVSFVDREGVELFRRLRSRQVELSNCSRFVAEQLKAPVR
jgi:anti-anti-sigma regulatory factor